MNRVIRFRGKRKDSKECVYGDLHTLCGNIHDNPELLKGGYYEK